MRLLFFLTLSSHSLLLPSLWLNRYWMKSDVKCKMYTRKLTTKPTNQLNTLFSISIAITYSLHMLILIGGNGVRHVDIVIQTRSIIGTRHFPSNAVDLLALVAVFIEVAACEYNALLCQTLLLFFDNKDESDSLRVVWCWYNMSISDTETTNEENWLNAWRKWKIFDVNLLSLKLNFYYIYVD